MEVIPHFEMDIGPFGTSFTKFGTFLKKKWYIQFLSYEDPYLITHVPFIPLETLGKLLKVVPHLITDFGNIGTSFPKFGTSFTKFETSFTKFGTL